MLQYGSTDIILFIMIFCHEVSPTSVGATFKISLGVIGLLNGVGSTR